MLLAVFAEAVEEWIKDKAGRLGAALAFYSLLSMGPVLLISISLAGLIFGHDAASGELYAQIRGLVGAESARAIEDLILKSSNTEDSIWATIIGTLTLVLVAAGFFSQLQSALNIVWNVKPPEDKNILRTVRRRFLPFVMLLGIGFLLFLSVMITAVITIFSSYVEHYLPAIVMSGMNEAVSVAFSTLLFAMIYKILPDVRILWREVWIGAFMTALLFAAGKYVIGLYIEHQALASAYGAAGSLIVVLFWIYYSALIFLFGAEFTQVYARSVESPA